MNYNNKSKNVAFCAAMTSLALIFSYIEAILPLSTGIPGVKLGIANLVVIIVIYTMEPKYGFVINFIRILIAGLLFNGLFGALYSLAGGLLSFAVMVILKKTGVFSIVGVSMAGGVAHNTGQLLVAALIISNINVFVYFPFLLFSGIISGILIGILAYFLLKKLPLNMFPVVS